MHPTAGDRALAWTRVRTGVTTLRFLAALAAATALATGFGPGGLRWSNILESGGMALVWLGASIAVGAGSRVAASLALVAMLLQAAWDVYSLGFRLTLPLLADAIVVPLLARALAATVSLARRSGP